MTMCIGTCKAQTFNFGCSEPVKWTETNGVYSNTDFPGYSYTIQEVTFPSEGWLSNVTVPAGKDPDDFNQQAEVLEILHTNTRSAIAGAN